MGVACKEFSYNCEESRCRRGEMCFVSLKVKDRKNSCKFCSVQNVCARTALTDCSSNKGHLLEIVILQRNFIHISVVNCTLMFPNLVFHSLQLHEK